MIGKEKERMQTEKGKNKEDKVEIRLVYASDS